MDELVRTLSQDGSVAVRALVATDLVREAARRHATSPTATVALGRTLMGALLLASESRSGEHVQVQIRGDGPIGTILVTANGAGEVRGYPAHPEADPDRRVDGRFDVAGAVGLGAMTVERNHASWKQPYSGIVPLLSGEIAQDFAHYLLESEQKPSAVALGVYVGPEGVEAAGGYLVQSLPGAQDDALAEIESRVGSFGSLSERLRGGASAELVVRELLGDVGAGELEHLDPRFHCPCSVRRTLSAVALLGRDEIREIVESGETLEVRCAFCAEVYQLTPDQVGSALPNA